VRLEELGQLKKFIHLIGSRTCDFPACSIVPQPTALPRDPTETADVIEMENLTLSCDGSSHFIPNSFLAGSYVFDSLQVVYDSLLHSFQTGSGDHTASCPKGTGTFSTRGKAARASTPSSAEVKNCDSVHTFAHISSLRSA
jgi:hypothetical protein